MNAFMNEPIHNEQGTAMRYCEACLSPEISVNSLLDRKGICNACNVENEYKNLTKQEWDNRFTQFLKIADQHRGANHSNYDCIIAVSGGKDSYFQAHVIKKICNLNPLLVTYHGNNYLPEGQANLDRMRQAFNTDHIVFGPGIDTLRKLNRLGFKLMGDMNWHAHAGIKITPIRLAVQLGIPLVIWGEATWSIAGMFSPDDYVEYNKRTVLEHDLRGYSWRDMMDKGEDLTEQELAWLEFPSDKDIQRVGVRGLYIGNYFKWEPNIHAQCMHDLYGFEFARRPFERTYRTMSNLDDMHENGIHDYMKFIKFGYGRGTDHASKDIRQGLLSREQGLEIVKKYDHVKPRKDLERWLEYVGMTEQEFDSIADTFRDSRVWWIQDGEWWKDTPWGGPQAFGPVHLKDPKRIAFFENNQKTLSHRP